ncbi:hypothetical protein DID78_06835 [Candidatus Marinamargulisbacteria bacterium SCGC AG-343-D04]|nr:hypothetical protein DID78_06835 [Candidatus Marinamargulisbacteria bacterium SCGC AG-343-D04]
MENSINTTRCFNPTTKTHPNKSSASDSEGDGMSLYSDSESDGEAPHPHLDENITASPYSTLTITSQQNTYEKPTPLDKNPIEILQKKGYTLNHNWEWIPPSAPNTELWHIQHKTTLETKEINIQNSYQNPEDNINILTDGTYKPITTTPLVICENEVIM